MRNSTILTALCLTGVVTAQGVQMPLPPFANTYSNAGHTRGFYFQAPTQFIITGLRVPDETNDGTQNVEVFLGAGSGGTNTSVFYANNQPSSQIIPTQIQVQQGDWVGVLGACGTTTMHNSYAASGSQPSSVLGMPVTLDRLVCQSNINQTNNQPLSYTTGQIGRVEVYVAPPSGLFAGFSASTTYGRPPLSVSFNDNSFSSDVAGVLAWDWDFDNDGTIDSTLQNPTHLYAAAGTYTVSLTVTDATHGSVTETKPGFVVVDPNAPPVIGTFVTSGDGCPNRGNTIYEVLPAGGWDLGNSAIQFSPAGNTYVAVPGGSLLPIGPNAIDTFMTDDSISTPTPLGFTFPYVDANGPATTIAVQILSNGYISLQPGAITDNRCCNADLASFLDDGPSFAVLGSDFDAPLGGRILYEQTTVGASRVFVVTWDQVEEDGSFGPNTFQAQLWDSGDFVMAYGQINAGSDTALVGWSPGGGQIAGGEIDFSSDLPFTPTPPFGLPIALSSMSIPTHGQTFTIDVNNVPASASAGALLLGAGTLDLDLGLLGAPSGCRLLQDVAIGSVPVAAASPTFSIPLNIAFNPTTIGLSIESQVGLIDLTLPQNVKVLTSDRGTITIGDIATVRAAAEGDNPLNGNPANNGYFSIQNLPASTKDIVGVRFDFTASSNSSITSDLFDTNGNSSSIGQFDHGNGMCTTGNAFYGTDVATGLVYGAPGDLPSSCDPSGFMGWVGSNPGTTNLDFGTLDFAFNDFQPGERFAFDCDTDTVPGNNGGGHAGIVVTITFADMTTVTGELEMIDAMLAEKVF